jgi:hypothetical protein
MLTCSKCGKWVEDSATVCSNCGAPVALSSGAKASVDLVLGIGMGCLAPIVFIALDITLSVMLDGFFAGRGSRAASVASFLIMQAIVLGIVILTYGWAIRRTISPGARAFLILSTIMVALGLGLVSMCNASLYGSA